MSTLYLSNGSKINDRTPFCANKIMNYIDDQNFDCRLFPFIVLVILYSGISVRNTSLYVTNYVISTGIHLSFQVESLCPRKRKSFVKTHTKEFENPIKEIRTNLCGSPYFPFIE